MTPYRAYFAIVGTAACILLGMLWLTPKASQPVTSAHKVASSPAIPAPSIPVTVPTPTAPVETVIVLKRNGDISIDGTPVTLPQLQQKLATSGNLVSGRRAILRYEKNAPFQSIQGILNACHAAQLTNIAFVSRSPDRDSGQE